MPKYVLSLVVKSKLWPFTNWLLKDGHGVYMTFVIKSSCNYLKVTPRRKTAYGAKLKQKQRQYRIQARVQSSASPSPIPGTTENATFAHFMKKSMYLKPCDWILAHLSRRLTRWAYSIPMVRRPSSTLSTWISLKPVGQSINFYV